MYKNTHCHFIAALQKVQALLYKNGSIKKQNHQY